jgi:CelD/BcsL family acetyltransferase involved in cellulose biosynthesis
MDSVDRTTAFSVRPLASGLEASWDRLARETLAAPFVRPGWVRAWAGAFGHDVSVACLERDGRLVAALPVVVEGRTARTAADWHVPCTEVVASDYESVIALLRGLDVAFARVSLDFVPDGSMTELAGSAVLESRPRRRIERMMSPFITTTGSWADYRATISTKKFREIRRRRRRLAEQHGPVAYEVVDGAGSWRESLEIGLALEASGWKGEAGTAVESAADTAAFYRDVAEWAAREKMLEVGVLRAGDRPIAFDLAIFGGTRVWLLKTGFDHELSRYAPGQIIRHDAIEAAFERGLDSYEFAGESAPWKEDWTDTARAIVTIDAHARSLIGRATLLAARATRAARVQGGRILGRAS